MLGTSTAVSAVISFSATLKQHHHVRKFKDHFIIDVGIQKIFTFTDTWYTVDRVVNAAAINSILAVRVHGSNLKATHTRPAVSPHYLLA